MLLYVLCDRYSYSCSLIIILINLLTRMNMVLANARNIYFSQLVWNGLLKLIIIQHRCKILYVTLISAWCEQMQAPDKKPIYIYIIPLSSPTPMLDHLLESSHRDDSNKWSNIGFGEEITQVVSIEANFMQHIWSSEVYVDL